MIYTLSSGKKVDITSNIDIALLTTEEYCELLKVVKETNEKGALSKQ